MVDYFLSWFHTGRDASVCIVILIGWSCLFVLSVGLTFWFTHDSEEEE